MLHKSWSSKLALVALIAVGFWARPILAAADEPSPDSPTFFKDWKPPASGCECYCRSKDGAVDVGSATGNQDCNDGCLFAGSSGMAACATKIEETPYFSPTCFTDMNGVQAATVCKKTCGEGGGALGTAQPPECPEGGRYCYCTGVPAQLEIPINGSTTVKNVGDYIQIVYRYLLGFSMVVAIVMVMVGGLRYLMTAGGAGNVKAAKEQIKKSIIGLVLLFSAALLLQTVNPQLLHLGLPPLPAQSKINLLALAGVEKCTSNADCYSGYWCEADGLCSRTHGCSTNTDCVSPDQCISEFCVTQNSANGTDGNACREPGDTCSDGSKCIDTGLVVSPKLCSKGVVHSPCVTTSDCAGANVCVERYCVLKGKSGRGHACGGDADCDTNLTCVSGSCAAPPQGNGGSCAFAAECSSGLSCLSPGSAQTCVDTPSECRCSNRAAGSPCFQDANCTSGTCDNGSPNIPKLGTCR